MTHDSPYLPGPPVVGFWGLFENDFGSSSTPVPYCTVAPTKIGSALLPFHCPHCRAVVDFSDPRRREMFHDTRRWTSWRGLKKGTVKNRHYWCPSCGARFFLDLAGTPLVGPLAPGTVAPSRVTCGDVAVVQREIADPSGTDVLGAR